MELWISLSMFPFPNILLKLQKLCKEKELPLLNLNHKLNKSLNKSNKPKDLDKLSKDNKLRPNNIDPNNNKWIYNNKWLLNNKCNNNNCKLNNNRWTLMLILNNKCMNQEDGLWITNSFLNKNMKLIILNNKKWWWTMIWTINKNGQILNHHSFKKVKALIYHKRNGLDRMLTSKKLKLIKIYDFWLKKNLEMEPEIVWLTNSQIIMTLIPKRLKSPPWILICFDHMYFIFLINKNF